MNTSSQPIRIGVRSVLTPFVVAALLLVVLISGACSIAPGADSAPASGGTLFVGGGGRLPDEVFDAFAEASGARGGTLVVIPTASRRADEEDGRASIVETWNGRGFPDVRLLHTRDRAVSDSEGFVALLDSADAVWIGGGDQNRLADAYRDTQTQSRLQKFLDDGGVIGGSSAGAAIVSDPMIGGGRDAPRIVGGLGLWPGVIVDQHFSQRGRFHRLRLAVNASADSIGEGIGEGIGEAVGVGVDERTAVVVRGDQVEVLGEGRVALVTRRARDSAERAGQTLRVEWLDAGEPRRLR
ncbi:MAG: cyanophycinase [Planctomycetota bacterium]